MMSAAEALFLTFSFALAVELLLGRPALRLARVFAARPVWCGAVLALLPILLRLALLPHHPEPTPSGADDFSYLLQSDTFSHFRLANPPHPMHRFFEANFVLQEPHYSSVFAPGQGLFLAIGQVFTAHAWAGVLLSEGVLCALCYWMLLGWISPLWSLAGGIFAVCEFGPLSQWMNSYWGGAVAGIAGCLIFGSLPRLREARTTAAIALGIGLGLSWWARPFETVLASVSVLLYFAMRSRKFDSRRLFRIAGIALAAAAPFAAFTLLHDHAVTGRWMKLPYMQSREQYGVPASFTFQQNSVPQRRLTPEQALDYQTQSKLHGEGLDTPARFFSRLAERAPLYRFFFYPTLYIALLAFFLSLREIRFRWVLATVLIFVLGTNFYPYFYPHYIAALACVFVLMSVTGLRELGKLRLGRRAIGPPAARLLALWTGIWFLLLFGMQLTGNDRWMALAASYDPAHFINWGDAEGRAAIHRHLEEMPGQQLVFVHYAPGHAFHEWIHNAANIDRAKVVRALDLGDDENRQLIAYYPQRTVWLLEPDVWPPRLTPYPPQQQPPSPAPPSVRPTRSHPERDSIQTLPESGFVKHPR